MQTHPCGPIQRKTESFDTLCVRKLFPVLLSLRILSFSLVPKFPFPSNDNTQHYLVLSASQAHGRSHSLCNERHPHLSSEALRLMVNVRGIACRPLRLDRGPNEKVPISRTQRNIQLWNIQLWNIQVPLISNWSDRSSFSKTINLKT